MLQIEINGLLGLTKNKKGRMRTRGDSHAADRGYAAEVRP